MGALGSVVRASETATLAYAEDVWIRFDAAAETTVVAVATLALVVIGYLLLTGQLSLQAGQFFPRLFRWVFLLALLLNMPLLFPWAYALVTGRTESDCSISVGQRPDRQRNRSN